MTHSTLSPVFSVLRAGVHALVIATTAVVLVRALLNPTATSGATVASCLLLLVTYVTGIALARAAPRPRPLVLAWCGALVGAWLLTLATTPDAVYVAFGLFFVELHVLGAWGVPAVLATTVAAIVGFGLHEGWSAAIVVGPLLGAGVALLVAWGYRMLAREAAARDRLVADLLRTRELLAETERTSGMLAERARLAREIHDTVAQGLASIQLLLHAAERADPTGPGIGHIRMARETAAASLADARRFIRELAPPELDGQGSPRPSGVSRTPSGVPRDSTCASSRRTRRPSPWRRRPRSCASRRERSRT
ncbi:MAG: histidine kinase dimerization/phosphoacceptor domain-containing protein [Chloroflexota bacterium]